MSCTAFGLRNRHKHLALCFHWWASKTPSTAAGARRQKHVSHCRWDKRHAETPCTAAALRRAEQCLRRGEREAPAQSIALRLCKGARANALQRGWARRKQNASRCDWVEPPATRLALPSGSKGRRIALGSGRIAAPAKKPCTAAGLRGQRNALRCGWLEEPAAIPCAAFALRRKQNSSRCGWRKAPATSSALPLG